MAQRVGGRDVPGRLCVFVHGLGVWRLWEFCGMLFSPISFLSFSSISHETRWQFGEGYGILRFRLLTFVVVVV